MKPHIKKVYCDNIDDWMWCCQDKLTRYFGFGLTPESAYSIWHDGARPAGPNWEAIT